MTISLADFKKWQSKKQAAVPVTEAQPKVKVVTPAAPPPIGGVISSKSKATISGVVSANPKQTIVPQGFVGPVTPKPAPAISTTPKSLLSPLDAFGPVTPKTSTQTSILKPDSGPMVFSASNVAPKSYESPLPPIQPTDKKLTTFKNNEPSTSAGKSLDQMAMEDLKKVPGLAKDIIRTPLRAGLSVLSSFTGNEDIIEPQNSTQKFLIGDEPVKPFVRSTTDLELSLQDQGFGKAALPAAFSFTFLSTAADLYPGGGKNKIIKEATELFSKQLGKGLAKEEALNIVYKKFGTEVGQRIEKEILPAALEKVAKESVETLAPKVVSTNTERGFITTVKESANTAKKQVLADRVEGSYKVITNAETLAEAQKLVTSNADEALRVAKQTKPTAKSMATAQVLVDKYVKEGNFEQAIDLVEITAKKATESGQAIQALSMWERLTPEGVLRYAQRQFDNANDLIKNPAKKLKLSPSLIKKLRQQASDLARLPSGRLKEVETAKMLKTIADEIPVSLGKKISAIQTLGQLLNPKTLVRNIVGNTGFAVAENIKDVVATPIDWFVSKFTKERTKALPSLIAQARGYKKGLVEGFEDAWLGIDTSAASTQFDLPKSNVFKSKIMKGLERTLSVALKAPDRAAYQGAFENSLATQMKLKNVTKPTSEMLHIAHQDGLYRTFQDESTAAKIFMGIKKALNANKDFGIGDVVIKYPKTPGNLLARGIEYSPAGFLKSVVELGKPLFGRGFDQRAFVESTSRALTGTTGLVGVGAIMHRLGLITGKRGEDKDINSLERATGLGQYKLNLSGLKRFIVSGFDPDEAKLKEGDKTVSYDWFQPAAIGLSMGANIDEGLSIKSGLGTLLASMGEGADTLGEQPLVQGVTRPFRYAENPSDAALNALQGVPTSFIPTLLGQVRQVVDPNQRNTQDPDYINETVNLAKNKIPGLSQLLPKKYGGLGEELKNENSMIETFFSPGYVDEYKFTPEQKQVLDIYKNSGLKIQAPRIVSPSQTITIVTTGSDGKKSRNTKNIKLTGEQQSKMQAAIGKLTQERFSGLIENPKFLAMSDEKKASTMAAIMSDILTAAKYQFLEHRPKSLSDREKKYIKILRGTE